MSELGAMSQREYLDECRKLDIERHERSVEQHERLVAQIAELFATATPRKVTREEMRSNYVRHYAPTILAALAHPAQGCVSLHAADWRERRKHAIEQAGLLFDEIEAL